MLIIKSTYVQCR